MAKELVLIQIANSIYAVNKSDPELCESFDRDCRDVVVAGRAYSCAVGIMPHGIYIPSEGKCPFVGD